MFPTVNLGSIAFPTGPLSALLAVWLAMELASRRGQKLGLKYDDLLGGLILALVIGIVAARLAHVMEFWSAYQGHMLDILALRPTGLSAFPGIATAGVAGYGFMVWRRMDPVKVGASVLTGLVGGGVLFFLGAFLSGRIVGTTSELPWALPYGNHLRHPVGLYLSLGCLPIWILLWYRERAPQRELLIGVFCTSLLLLFVEAFVLYRGPTPMVRWPQLAYLLAASGSAFLLARQSRSVRQPVEK